MQIPKPTKRKKPPKPNKEKTRAEVAERDGYKCLLCQSEQPGLHLHRIQYGAYNPGYTVDNCVLLCNADHVPVVHANKRIWMPILLDYINTLDATKIQDTYKGG